MSGHAPEFPSLARRIVRWFDEASDMRVAAVLIALTVGVLALFVVLNQRMTS